MEYLDAALALECINSANDGITVADISQPDCPLIFVNEAFEKMTGYTSQEVVGKNCRFLQADEPPQPGLDLIRKSLATETSCRVILKNFKKDGTLFWNELSMSPLLKSNAKARYFVGIQKDVTNDVIQKELIQFLSEHDDLTGLFNYRGFFSRVNSMIEVLHNSSSYFGIGIVDVDHFKKINDEFGHMHGNVVLKLLGNEFLKQFSKDDIISRLGGDEFFFAFTHPNSSTDWFPAKIRSCLNAINLLLPKNCQVSLSIGYQAVQCDKNFKLDDLIKKVDAIMYQNKREYHRSQQGSADSFL